MIRNPCQSASNPVQTLETRYRRFAAVTLAFLSARCEPTQCVAIHRDIWDRIGARRSRRISDAAMRELLVAHAAARCSQTEAARFDEHAESLRQAMAGLEPDEANLVHHRLANDGYSDLASVWQSKAEALTRAFDRIRRRWARAGIRHYWSPAIPNDPCQTAAWLERHLVGGRLGMLVAELGVVHSATAHEPAFLSSVLRGHRRAAVLETGLAALSHRRIVALLTHPRLLLDLQAIVLAHGGPYWNEVRPIDDWLEILADRQWQFIAAA